MRTYPANLYLPFRFPGLPHVGCAFTTRMGGASSAPFDRGNMSYEVGDQRAKVASNRKLLRMELGFDAWQELIQVHGTRMYMDPLPSDSMDSPALEGDGLATATPRQALVVKTADCQPILLAHTGGAHIAALHVGWRGNAANMPGVGVKAFCDHYGLNPRDVMAVRGPSLGPAASCFTNFEQEFGDGFRPWLDQHTQCLNLWQLTRDQLQAAGLLPGNIFSIDLCTYNHPELFFSYRRHNRTGRQLGLIWIKRFPDM